MSSTTIDSLGIHRVRLDQRLADFIAAFQAIYGADINVDPDTIDGQFLGIVSEMAADADSLLEQIYLARSPASAVGADLSRIVQLIGIKRNLASYSTANVVHTGVNGTFIPSGSLIDTTDTPPAHFQTVGDVTIDASGTAPGVVQATVTGPVFAAAGAISVIKTVISGWASVTNAAAVNLGSNQETDAALRVRRAASVAINAKSVVDGIYAALANIQGVSEAVVFENKTGSPISRPGSADLPPNCIQCVVQGGLDADIAAAIWAKASAGVTQVGAVPQPIVDSQGNTQVIRFDRPTNVSVYAQIILAVRDVFNIPMTDAQKLSMTTTLANYGNASARIGRRVVRAELFPVLTGAISTLGLGDAVSISDLWIDTAPLVFARTKDIPIPFASRPAWDVSRIGFTTTPANF